MDRMDEREYCNQVQELKARGRFDFVVVLLKSKMSPVYNTIKTVLTSERENIGVPSQFIVNNPKNFTPPRATSIARNIAIQVKSSCGLKNNSPTPIALLMSPSICRFQSHFLHILSTLARLVVHPSIKPMWSCQVYFHQQMYCKTGSVPWKLKFGATGLMVVGMDVFHQKNKPSVLGFVASMDKSLSR